MFNEDMRYSKLNKKALDVLARSGALNPLVDSRFSGLKHFWSAIAVDRPRKPKNLEANIVKYYPEGDFTLQDKIHFLTELTGQFPLSWVISDERLGKLGEMCIPPISEYDKRIGLTWCIPRNIVVKKTSTGKDYLQVDVTDSNSSSIRIRCWGVDLMMGDVLQVNKPYLIRPKHDEQWGFSTRDRITTTWKCLTQE